MKLNAREKIMLIVLGAAAVVALSFFLLIRPQLDRAEELRVQQDNLREQIETMEREILRGEGIREGIQELNQKIEEMTVVFYPEILMDRIIVLLDEIVRNTEIVNPGMTFARPEIETVRMAAEAPEEVPFALQDLAVRYRELLPREDQEIAAEENILPASDLPEHLRSLEAIVIQLNLEGTYEQMIAFMSEIENLERSILITNLVAVSNEEGELVIVMELVMYAIPKVHDQDPEFYEWPFEDVYGKDNPFLETIPE